MSLIQASHMHCPLQLASEIELEKDIIQTIQSYITLLHSNHMYQKLVINNVILAITSTDGLQTLHRLTPFKKPVTADSMYFTKYASL